MVRKYTCAFCNKEIEPGFGSMYVRADGKVTYICSSKCYKNYFKLKRNPRKLKWTNW
ncbi:MAG: 50S ribosomal protein L24e [Candidatus Helarchaeota archaeon]